MNSQALPSIFDAPAYAVEPQMLPQEEPPVSPTSKIRLVASRVACPHRLRLLPPNPDPPQPRVEELAKTPDFLGVHEVTSVSPLAIPGSPLVLAVELHLGTQSALLRTECDGQEASVTMLEQPSGEERAALPHCFTAHWVHAYRVRPLSYSVEQVEETVMSATGDPLRISSEVVRAVVAVDRPTFDPIPASLRSAALKVGESRRVWLTSTSINCQRHTLVGAAGDHFDLSLHILPLAVPGRGDEMDASFLFSAEIVLMRTGSIESHGAIQVEESAKGETVTVGDYKVAIKKMHAPLSQKDMTSGPERIRSEYPILILHIQLKVERISEEEAERHQWDTLFS